MPDVFSRTSSAIGGAMSADLTKLTFAGDTSNGLIVQQISVSYQQQITRLYALESGKIYFVAGQTSGAFQCQHIVGPNGIASDFYALYGNVCNNSPAVNLSMTTGCQASDSGERAKVKLSNLVISGINITAQAQNMIIYSGFDATFVAMEFV